MIHKILFETAFSTTVGQIFLLCIFFFVSGVVKRGKKDRGMYRAYWGYLFCMAGIITVVLFTTAKMDEFFIIDIRFLVYQAIAPVTAIAMFKLKLTEKKRCVISLMLIAYLTALLMLNFNKLGLNLKFSVFLKRFNYVGLFVGFVGVYFYLLGYRKSGVTIAVLTWLVGLMSLAKWTIIPLACFPFFLLLPIRTGKIGYLKISAALLIGVAGSMYLFVAKDKLASYGGYQSWDEYWERRITRENTLNKHDQKVFGYFSDGGRTYIWTNRLQDFKQHPLIGAGLGLSRDIQIDDHNLVVFLLSRIGLSGFFVFGYFLLNYIRELRERSLMEYSTSAQKRVLVAFAVHNAVVLSVGQGFFCPYFLISDFAVLGLILNTFFAGKGIR